MNRYLQIKKKSEKVKSMKTFELLIFSLVYHNHAQDI